MHAAGLISLILCALKRFLFLWPPIAFAKELALFHLESYPVAHQIAYFLQLCPHTFLAFLTLDMGQQFFK